MNGVRERTRVFLEASARASPDTLVGRADIQALGSLDVGRPDHLVYGLRDQSESLLALAQFRFEPGAVALGLLLVALPESQQQRNAQQQERSQHARCHIACALHPVRRQYRVQRPPDEHGQGIARDFLVAIQALDAVDPGAAAIAAGGCGIRPERRARGQGDAGHLGEIARAGQDPPVGTRQSNNRPGTELDVVVDPLQTRGRHEQPEHAGETPVTVIHGAGELDRPLAQTRVEHGGADVQTARAGHFVNFEKRPVRDVGAGETGQAAVGNAAVRVGYEDLRDMLAPQVFLLRRDVGGERSAALAPIFAQMRQHQIDGPHRGRQVLRQAAREIAFLGVHPRHGLMLGRMQRRRDRHPQPQDHQAGGGEDRQSRTADGVRAHAPASPRARVFQPLWL